MGREGAGRRKGEKGGRKEKEEYERRGKEEESEIVQSIHEWLLTLAVRWGQMTQHF